MTSSSPALPVLTSITATTTGSSDSLDYSDSSSSTDVADDKKEQRNVATPEELKKYVMIPKDLVKHFDLGKVWENSTSKQEPFLVKDPATDGGNLIVMVIDCSYVGVTHGAAPNERIDILIRRGYTGDKYGKELYSEKGLANTIAANRLYHEQLKALMVKRGITELPLVNRRGDDESGGCNPQLRFDMVMTISLSDVVGQGMDPKPAAFEGRGTLIALDLKDMCQWVRNNVVGVLPDNLWNLVGQLPANYAEMSAAEFATWLDEAIIRVEEMKAAKSAKIADANSKRKRERETFNGADEAYQWEVASLEEREKIRLARIAAIESELAWLKAANPSIPAADSSADISSADILDADASTKRQKV